MNQGERIIDYLHRFGAITPMEAFLDLGVTKLATRISELERKGFQFKKSWVTVVNRYGEKVKYMCYRLKEA